MTKTDARNEGTERGIRFAETFTREMLLADDDAYRENIAQAARSSAVGTAGFRSVDSLNAQEYCGAFVKAACERFRGRRNELPEVQAANRRKGIEWALEDALRSAKGDLETFQTKFTENPCYAFEWSHGALKAAATQEVVTRLQAILAEHGVDEMVEYARVQALQGARYPSESTSQVSNLMAGYKTAAYAEFAGRR